MRDSSSWFVIETLPRREQLAIQHLEKQGFRNFLPRLRRTMRRGRHSENVLTPLFPGYAFVQFNPAKDQWRAINSTIGVKRLVGGALSVPHAMPQDVMDSLLDRCEDGVMRHPVEGMYPGEVVRVIQGPFTDQLATIQTMDARGRVRVLLSILGTTTTVWVKNDSLTPA